MTGEPTHTTSELKGAARPSYINYRLKSEVSIMLRCQLCSIRYTAFRIKKCSKSTSTIHAYQKKEIVPRARNILRLCSTSYTAVQLFDVTLSHLRSKELPRLQLGCFDS